MITAPALLDRVGFERVESLPRVMGILNVTPDSFFDGSRWSDLDSAVEHGKQLFSEGAEFVDVGGESTRPGSSPVAIKDELARVVPVIAELTHHGRVSVDTRHREVAEAAIAAGASLINDVSASLCDVAAQAKCGWIAMHMLGEPKTMQIDPIYDDVVDEVSKFLVSKGRMALELGIEEVWLDPGIGFGKTIDHNLALLASVQTLASGEFPILIGASRKSMIGVVTDGSGPEQRLEGSLAVALWAASLGASMLRVHDVGATMRALRLLGEPVDEEE